jgi:hypothetical protein
MMVVVLGFVVLVVGLGFVVLVVGLGVVWLCVLIVVVLGNGLLLAIDVEFVDADVRKMASEFWLYVFEQEWYV